MRFINLIFSIDFLLTPFYTYKLINLFIFKNISTLFALTTKLLLTLMITLLIYPTIILLAIFDQCVEIYLKRRHPNNFHAMLNGCDRIWVVKSASRSIINAIYAISSHETPQIPNSPNLPSEIFAYMTEKYRKITKLHPRFSSVIKSCCGLQYFHIIDLDISASVKYMDDYENTEEFYNLLEAYSNKAMPKGDSYLWEVNVGRKPVIWYDGSEIYPILIRYHHSMGDGVGLVTLMTTHLLKDGVEMMRKKCQTYKAIMSRQNTKIEKETNNEREIKTENKSEQQRITKNSKKVKKININEFLDKEFYYPTLTVGETQHLLYGKEISGKKHLIFVWEKPGDGYVAKVKRVKNFYNVAFADVVNTAISASLHEHFKEFSTIRTKKMLATNPYFLMSTEFDEIVHFNEENVPITKLGNNFAIGFSELPIYLDDNNFSECSGDKNKNNNVSISKMADSELLRRLRTMKKSNDKLKNALDFGFCYWQMKMFGGLPLAIGKALLLANESSISISNFPGNTTSRFENGNVVKDTFVFGNNYAKLGITITLFTYDEHFRVGWLIDKSLILERADAQRLADGMLKFIDEMVATLPESEISNKA